jgi:hypothetical protein
MPLNLRCLLVRIVHIVPFSRILHSHQTPPTPETRLRQVPSFSDLVAPDDYDYDSEPFDMPMPLPVTPYQPKWIHRRLWTSEEKDGNNGKSSFLSNVIPRSWSKPDSFTPATAVQPECTQKPGPNRVVTVQAPHPLARSPSVTPSVSSSISSRTASKCQLVPKKSILSSSTSLSMKNSKRGRARSGSSPSVKFAEKPTYYYHDYEFAYEYESEFDKYETRPSSPVSSTMPCLSPSIPRKGTQTSKVRQVLSRLMPSTRRPPERPSISGPYPLWKGDGDGSSIRSVRSIPCSVRSAPASRSKVRTLWGRMMACTMQ